MIKHIWFLGAAILASSLSGCAVASSPSFSPAVTSDIQTTLAIGCPMLSALQRSGLKLTSKQNVALKALMTVCPPNPPPTSELLAAEDLVRAYLVLKPLLK